MNEKTFRKMYTPEEIKAIAGGGGAGLEVIEITDVSATSGTLNEAQMAIVNSNTPSCVKFNNEYYYKNDENHTEGITVYTHTGYTETDGGSTIKYFSITLATSAWTLTSTNLGKKLYMKTLSYRLSDDLSGFYLTFTFFMDNEDSDNDIAALLRKYWISSYSNTTHGYPFVNITQKYDDMASTNVIPLWYNVYETDDSGYKYRIKIVYIKDNQYLNKDISLSISTSNAHFKEVQ